MLDINQISKLDDIGELLYYLDYIEQLIEMFEKRKASTKELISDHLTITKKVEMLRNNK